MVAFWGAIPLPERPYDEQHHFAAKLQMRPRKIKNIRFRMTLRKNPPKSSNDPILLEDIPNGVVLMALIGFFDWGSAWASVR
eukprot:scaffold10119_cov129-Skeletonema_dohrnii-CCMP3373.AAC.1